MKFDTKHSRPFVQNMSISPEIKLNCLKVNILRYCFMKKILLIFAQIIVLSVFKLYQLQHLQPSQDHIFAINTINIP